MDYFRRTNQNPFLIQLIFCSVGVTIIIWGSFLYSQLAVYKPFTSVNYTVESCMMLAAGCTLTLSICIEVLSWCRNSFGQCLAFILQLSFYILLLSAGIQAIVNISNINKYPEFTLSTALQQYGFENRTTLSHQIDSLQYNLHCCGSYNVSDWMNTSWGITHQNEVPESCCKSEKSDYSASNTTTCKYYTNGCFNQMQEAIHGCDVTIASVSITIFIMMILSPLWTGMCKRNQVEL